MKTILWVQIGGDGGGSSGRETEEQVQSTLQCSKYMDTGPSTEYSRPRQV